MVYFIQGEQTQLVKIGKATSIPRRLRVLQTGSPDQLTVLAVIEDTDDDHQHQKRFQADWVYGEWFKPSEALMAFVSAIPGSTHSGLTYRPPNPHTHTKVKRAEPVRNADGQRRQQRRAQGQCAQCGAPSEAYRCVGCAVRCRQLEERPERRKHKTAYNHQHAAQYNLSRRQARIA